MTLVPCPTMPGLHSMRRTGTCPVSRNCLKGPASVHSAVVSPWCRPRRQCLQLQAAITSDYSTRVKGNVRHVYNYVSDFQYLAAWYPDITSLTVTRGEGRPLNIRHQYEVEQKVSGFNVTTLYEVTDMQQDKKIVYYAGSELHTATEQLIFMPDRNDPTFTVVRYMTEVELTEWRKALQPILAGALRARPEQALKKLTSLLNSSQSPIRAQASQPGARPRGNGSGGWSFNNMLNNLRTEASQESSNGWYSSAGKRKEEPQVDVLGYYAALGLDGARPRNVTSDDIKAAFRRQAQSMHPDKFSQADEDDRFEAEQAFIKVQRAYEVLRDPQQRKLYDAGKPLQVEESVM